MAISDAQRLAVKIYRSEKRDQIAVDVPKGKREVYKRIAAKLGKSLAQLIQDSVEEFSRAHAGEDWTANQLAAGVSMAGASTVEKPGETLSREEKKLLEEFRQMPVNSQKHVRGLIRAIIGAQVESD